MLLFNTHKLIFIIIDVQCLSIYPTIILTDIHKKNQY